MAKKYVYLSHELMHEMCHRLAVTFFAAYQEPIPPYEKHDDQLLDSSINLPQATFNRRELYPTLSLKATVLFYSLIKNHPFENGNKRIATAAVLVFLYLNGYWILDPKKGIYRQALKVASSLAQDRDKILHHLELWFRNRMVRVKRLRKRDIPLWLIDRALHVLSAWTRRFWRQNHNRSNTAR